MPDRLTPERRSRLMSRVRSKDTGIELAVRRAVHARGLRYRKNVRRLPGTPDLVFSGPKVAIFVDGDFWHGWDFASKRQKLPRYWVDKIDANRRRDIRNTAELQESGWLVLRFWGHEVLQDVEAVADQIEESVRFRSSQSGPKTP